MHWNDKRAFEQLPVPVLSEHGLSLDVALQTDLCNLEEASRLPASWGQLGLGPPSLLLYERMQLRDVNLNLTKSEEGG